MGLGVGVGRGAGADTATGDTGERVTDFSRITDQPNLAIPADTPKETPEAVIFALENGAAHWGDSSVNHQVLAAARDYAKSQLGDGSAVTRHP